MKYINTKTGAIIETPAKISGGDWKALKKDKAPAPTEGKETTKEGADK